MKEIIENINILLIEDSLVDIMLVKRAFNNKSMINDIFVANNGVEGLNMLQEENSVNPLPDIIMLDINMPKMNGIEFLAKLRSIETLKKLPVFVMTTSTHDRDKIESYDLNVSGYIPKPISFSAFVEKIKTSNELLTMLEHQKNL